LGAELPSERSEIQIQARAEISIEISVPCASILCLWDSGCQTSPKPELT